MPSFYLRKAFLVSVLSSGLASFSPLSSATAGWCCFGGDDDKQPPGSPLKSPLLNNDHTGTGGSAAPQPILTVSQQNIMEEPQASEQARLREAEERKRAEEAEAQRLAALQAQEEEAQRIAALRQQEEQAAAERLRVGEAEAQRLAALQVQEEKTQRIAVQRQLEEAKAEQQRQEEEHAQLQAALQTHKEEEAAVERSSHTSAGHTLTSDEAAEELARLLALDSTRGDIGKQFSSFAEQLTAELAMFAAAPLGEASSKPFAIPLSVPANATFFAGIVQNPKFLPTSLPHYPKTNLAEAWRKEHQEATIAEFARVAVQFCHKKVHEKVDSNKLDSTVLPAMLWFTRIAFCISNDLNPYVNPSSAKLKDIIERSSETGKCEFLAKISGTYRNVMMIANIGNRTVYCTAPLASGSSTVGGASVRSAASYRLSQPPV